MDDVAREVGVGGQTLERWRSDALSRPARERAWTAAARLEAVLTTAAMDEAARGAWCREHGVYAQELQRWRESATQAREQNPRRWSRTTRDWSRIDVVTLNPERATTIAGTRAGVNKPPLAA